jgi:hypothetical protein
MIDEIAPMLRSGKRELARVRTSPGGYGDPVPSYTLLLRLDDVLGFYVETTADSDGESRQWRVSVDPREAQDMLSRLVQARVPAFLEAPATVDGQYVDVTVFGRGADLTIGWWNVPPAGAEVFGEFVGWLLDNSPVRDLEDDHEEVLYDRLARLVESLSSSLFHIDRNAMHNKVLVGAIAELRMLPSPAPMHDDDSMLDFLGDIKAGHAQNDLYEIAFGSARSELEMQVAKLDEGSQIVLLLPLVEGDTEDLARDRDIDEWAECLRSESSVWLDKLMDDLMRRIPERYID